MYINGKENKKDVMSKLSPVKSKNKSSKTNANTTSLSPAAAAAADVDDVKPHTNDIPSRTYGHTKLRRKITPPMYQPR